VAGTDGSRRPKRPSNGGLRTLVRDAVAQFSDLSGSKPEQISGLRSSENGWSVLVEVVEVERIPATTSVLSTYRVDVDSGGQLIGYERIRRYTRAATDNQS
jgi:hypothetical protein